MPKNTKPGLPGPSPSGNKMTTGVQEFAAPAIVLDRGVPKGFSAGNGGSHEEVTSKQEIGHHGDNPSSNEAFLNAIVRSEATDSGVGDCKAESSSALNPQIAAVLEKSSTNHPSGKVDALKAESPDSSQTDLAKYVPAQTEARTKESPGTKQTTNPKP